MARWAKKLVQEVFRKAGLEIHRARPQPKEAKREDKILQPTFPGTLQRLLRHQIDFETVVDVGASNGCWSASLQRVFPAKSHLLIEANPVHEPALRAACQANPKWHSVLKAAGETEGKLFFDASDPLGGHLSETPINPNYKPFPVTTIDAEVRRLDLPPPFFIKLDTHGVEVPILNGAARALERAALLVIECYNFPSGPPCLSFWEMCAWLEEKGFRPLDVHDILYREYDGAFWQLDLVFARKSWPGFLHTKYR